jgi:DNA repair exonuclease SbcCD nuclease subunit
MLKFLYSTDFHVRASSPAARLDDFHITILKKIEYWLRKGEELEVDGYLNGGDWLDRPDVPYSTLRKLLKILKTAKKPIYSVGGNHEEYGMNPETFERTAFGILEGSGVINMLSPTERTTVSDKNCDTVVSLSGCHAYFDLDKGERVLDYTDVPQPVTPDATKIHIVHGFLSKEKRLEDIPHTLIEDVLDTNADIVLTGHDHQGFGVIKKNGRIFCNPGALARVSAAVGDVNLEVKFALITIDGNKMDIELIPLPIDIARPANEVLDRTKLVQEKKHKEQLGNFVQKMSKAEVITSFNVYNVLNALAKEENLEDNIVTSVRTQLEKAESQLQTEE